MRSQCSQVLLQKCAKMLDHMENVYTALALQNFRNIGKNQESEPDERKSNLKVY